MVRHGVTETCPEGVGWLSIPTQTGREVSQVSVARSGLVWAVTWHGSALVRLGVSLTDPSGTHWCEVSAPAPDHPLMLVGLGGSIVWGLSRGGGVWLRQGVRSDCTGAGDTSSDQLSRGTRWVQMVGEVVMLSVGGGDQVMGVGSSESDERSVVVRTGVSHSDTSGKSWRPVTAGKIDCSMMRSVVTPAVRRYCSSNSSAGSSPAVTQSSSSDTAAAASGVGERVLKSAERRAVGLAVGGLARATLGRVPVAGPLLASAVGGAVMDEINREDLIGKVNDKGREMMSGGDNTDLKEGEEFKLCSNSMQQSAATLELDQSIYCSTHESLDTEDVSSPVGRLVLHDDDDDEWGAEQSEPVWVWISLGSYHLDHIPGQWLETSVGSVQSVSVEEETWRRSIINQLTINSQKLSSGEWSGYQTAIESSSWVKSALVKVNTGGGKSRWEQCVLELEQCGTKDGLVEFGTLSMFGQKNSHKEHLSLSEISCVSVCSEKSSPQMAVYTPARSVKLQPILIKFSGESELQDWHSELVMGMNSVHGTLGTPGHNSVFSVTGRGEVMVWDSEAASLRGEETSEQEGSQYSLEIPVADKPLPLMEKLINGFGPGSSLYTEIRINSSCDNFTVNLQTGSKQPVDICLHFNPRLGYEGYNHVVLNSYDGRRGEWGVEEKQPLVIMCDDGS